MEAGEGQAPSNDFVGASTLPEVWYGLVAAPTGSFGVSSRIAFVVGLACFIAALNLFGSSNPTASERLLASLVIVVCAIPSWVWLAGHDRALPFMPFFGMVFAVYYGAPLFLLRDYAMPWSGGPMPHALVTASLEVVLIGLLGVMAVTTVR